jgi:glutamate dehydrogenase (NAD(P)+)
MPVSCERDDTALVCKITKGSEIRGCLVIDSTIDGRSCGGLRISPDVDETQLREAARTMTLKYGFTGMPQGGAKAGVCGDPEAPEAEKMERLTEFGRAITALLQRRVYFPHQDMGTDNRAIRSMLERTGVHVRLRELRDTDSGYYTALSVRACAVQAARHLGMDLSKCTVAIEGFGKVGASVAELMAAAGATVVAVSTSHGAIYAPQGLQIPRLVQLARERGSRCVEDYPEAERIDLTALLELPVDLLSPCARAHSLHAGNAERVAARIVCPGANNPATPQAEEVLFERGVLVLPDFVTNCGGVIGGTMRFASLGDERITEFIDRHIGGRVSAILGEAERLGVAPSQIAEPIALRRFQRRKQAAERPAVAGRLLKAGLELYHRGLVPAPVMRALSPAYFDRALAGDD